MTNETVIYIIAVYDDECGEVEGAFTEEGELIDWWSSNDAVWRHEYFDYMMRKLGIEVKERNKALEAKLIAAAREC